MSSLDPINCGPGTTPRDRNTWVINTMKVMEHFTVIPLPNDAEGKTFDMDTMDVLPTPAHPKP
jgi:hypothetical protein